ncbi:Endo-1,4-beta-xylanase [Termitomyces sp. T112]|nr:Endo-1,4-beta-xylanase [Termitomyces sp. T112]
MIKLSTSFATLLVFSSLASVYASPAKVGETPTDSAGLLVATSKVELNKLAKKSHKLYFGSATDNFSGNNELADAAYKAILSDNKEFGQITPSNTMKWMYTEPERGVFNLTDAEEIVKFAKGNKQILRGHNCVWHSQLADWVTAGNFDAPTLASIVVTHCSTLVGHFKGDICTFPDSWDVINEPFNDDGTWRETVFYNTLNTSYIEIALRAARAADPAAKLYINDYNIDGTGAKSTAMINLVKSLKANNVPIDGVGLQGHLIVGQVPTDIEENIRQIAATGVEVAITELDIRMTLPVTAELLEQQKKDYETVVSACNAVPACIGITIWDYTDKYSWVPGVFAGQGAPLPWDENLVKKPAYDGIVEGFSKQ